MVLAAEPNRINDYADFWRYQIGVNVIPADTKNKKPLVTWLEHQDKPITTFQHNQWKADNTFSWDGYHSRKGLA